MKNKQITYCLIWKRGAGKDDLAAHSELPHTTVSDVLKTYCNNNWLPINTETLTQLGNTIFDGKTLAQALSEKLPEWWIITGLRKPETLAHLLKQQRCILIWILADDFLRRQRVHQRNRTGDTLVSYAHFLEHERQENALPNRQNINLLLAFCDIHLTNNRTHETFINQWKALLTDILKLQRPLASTHIDLQWYQHFSRAIVINEHNEILVFYDKQKELHSLPGGKCDRWETPDITVHREIGEELGIVEDKEWLSYCGSFAGLFHDWLSKWHWFHGVVSKDSILNKEPDKHTHLRRISKDQLEKTLGFETYVDSGLYHYCTNSRIQNRSLQRSHEFNELVKPKDNELIIQHYNPLTGIITLEQRTWTLHPSLIPLRITTSQKIQQGSEAQKKRMQ